MDKSLKSYAKEAKKRFKNSFWQDYKSKVCPACQQRRPRGGSALFQQLVAFGICARVPCHRRGEIPHTLVRYRILPALLPDPQRRSAA